MKNLKYERPWLKHYEAGVPHQIEIPKIPLQKFLKDSALSFPSSTSMIFYDRRFSYGELDTLSLKFSNVLKDLGIEGGDRVMLHLPNSPQYVFCYYGILKSGAVVVPANPLSVERELRHQVEDSQAKIMVTLDSFYKTAKKVREKTELERVLVSRIQDYIPTYKKMLLKISRKKTHPLDEEVILLSDLLSKAKDKIEEKVSFNDLAVIQYTGGTTGAPKGTMLTHENLVSNTLQTKHWFTGARLGKEVFLSAIPFFHVYGMTACMNLSIHLAATMVLLPRFRIKEVLKAIKKYQPTLFPGVPTMYVAIIHHPKVKKFRVSSIKACISGAAPLPIEVEEGFEKLTRGRLVEGYGLTETSPVTHANPIYGMRKTGFIGLPLPSTDAKIVDLQTSKNLGVREIGELLIKGPQVMKGYWRMPEETRRVIKDEWLYTGDIARMDADGYFQIIDRKKDMIISDGYDVFPRDVEEALYEHPKILEVCAIGVPHEYHGEVVKVFVVLRKGKTATPEEIIEFCRERLSKYKVPSLVEFREELPKSMVGKILRRVLEKEEREKGKAND